MCQIPTAEQTSKNMVVKSVLHLENTALATLNSKLSLKTSLQSTQIPHAIKISILLRFTNLYLAGILATAILKVCFQRVSLNSSRCKNSTCTIFSAIRTVRSIVEPVHSYPSKAGHWATRTKTGFPYNGVQLASFRGAWQCPGRGKPFFCAYYTWIYLMGNFYPSNPWFKKVKLIHLELDEVVKKKQEK